MCYNYKNIVDKDPPLFITNKGIYINQMREVIICPGHVLI